MVAIGAEYEVALSSLDFMMAKPKPVEKPQGTSKGSAPAQGTQPPKDQRTVRRPR